MSRGIAWILALVPQVAVVGGMIVNEEIGRARGTEVLLEVRAFDPMDMLSGRYVSTPLAMARLESAKVAHPEPTPEAGSRVYVRLRKGETYWEAAEVSATRPDPSAGPFLRARTGWFWSRQPELNLSIQLEYDIDRFYISEDAADPSVWDTGENRRHQLAVVARVDSSGRAHVVDLRVDGRPYAVWNREQRGKK